MLGVNAALDSDSTLLHV